MEVRQPNLSTKLRWSLPWLIRYPFWRLGEWTRRVAESDGAIHLIVVVANHFEPAWSEHGGFLPLDEQRRRLDEWCTVARATGNAVRDVDGSPFRHTNFYPAEQYDRQLLATMADLQAEGYGEVEVHLHHGVDVPDTEMNLRRTLVEFRDILAQEHNCLSQASEGRGGPRYAFVHGNLALANSAGGDFCGVDSEMQVLFDTGCYADMTLPAAPLEPQVPRLNAIYECGLPLREPIPHRTGPSLRVGKQPQAPIIFTGPLVLNWSRRLGGLPVPRLDDGVLAANYIPDFARLERWARARISVRGRPKWVFLKLYCHGFFPSDQDTCIGDGARRFWSEALEESARTGRYRIHFASAREAFNIAMAAVEGKSGNPGLYRDYKLQSIMKKARGAPPPTTVTAPDAETQHVAS